MIGAFFMAVKRYAEYRQIGDPSIAGNTGNHSTSITSTADPQYHLLCLCVQPLFRNLSHPLSDRTGPERSVPCRLHTRVHAHGILEQQPRSVYGESVQTEGLMVYSVFCLILIVFLLFVDIPFVDQVFRPLHMPGK